MSADLEALERRLRESIEDSDPEKFQCWDEDGERPDVSFEHLQGFHDVFKRAIDALAVLRQERTQLQGLTSYWRSRGAWSKEGQAAFRCCADQVDEVLSGSVVSPEAQDRKD